MGRLAELEIENFKSYKGRQVIGPFKSFTAIVGPNGAGKSNLMDAISFVLGVRTNQLRGNQLKDLINGANVGQGGRRAHVSLRFVDDNDEEHLFMRSILPTGGSEYRYNGKVVTGDEYTEVLRQHNILVKARNFLVFQGDVESIAQKSPRELAQLMEQISGSDALREEYERLKQEKDKATENTRFNFQKKKDITAEKKQYRQQKDEAERFTRLQGEIAETKAQHMLWQLYHIDKDLEARSTEVAGKSSQAEELKERRAAVDEALEKARVEQAKLVKNAASLEKKIAEKDKELSARRPKHIALQEQSEHVTKRIESLKTQLHKAEQDRKRHEAEIRELEGDIAAVANAERAFEQAVAAESQGRDMRLAESQMAEYQALKERVATETAADSAALEAQRRGLTSQREGMERCKERMTEIEGKLKQQADAKRQFEERRAKLSSYVDATQEQVSKLRQELDALQKSQQRAAKRQAELTQELEQTQAKLREAKADKAESERDRKMAGCIESLKRLFPGVHGKLEDLCRPTHRRYNVAVTVVLGRSMDAIVVDTERAALDCIRYMKEQHVGVATFIPLDTIKVKPTNERYRELGGSTKLVIDVIQHDASLRKALQYACGNAIVCDTMDEARQLCFGGRDRYKAVTLDGTLIHKNGLMTGGLSGIERRAQRWDEQEISTLKLRRDECTKELAEISRQQRKEVDEGALLSQISGLEHRLKQARTDLQVSVERIQTIDAETHALRDELSKTGPVHDTHAAEVKKIEADIAKITARRNKAEDAVFADFCRAAGIENIREYEERDLRVAQERAKKRQEFASQQARLRNQLEYERTRDTMEKVNHIKAQLKSDTESLKNLAAEEKAHQQQLERDSAELSAQRKQVEEVRKELAAREEKVKELRRTIAGRNKEISALQDQISLCETEVEQLRARRHAILKTCKVEEIALPLVSGSLDEVAENVEDLQSLSQADGPQPMDIDSLGTEVAPRIYRRESTIRPDYNVLARDIRNADAEEDIRNIHTQFVDRIKSMTTEMDRIAPNMRAIERLDDVKNRLKETEAEIAVVRKAAEDANARFNAVREKRHELFMAAFNHISREIDRIYKDLTKSPVQPLGGTAYLNLENSEEPYLHGVIYNAMPPLKRFRDIELLSGGEKTVAALALLFAIHSFQPSPFFVLDEVDAALDNANVNRVANYIRARSGGDFQAIVISLKDTLFEKADGLIGIYRDQREDSSHTLTIDLTEYSDDAPQK